MTGRRSRSTPFLPSAARTTDAELRIRPEFGVFAASPGPQGRRERVMGVTAEDFRRR
jgi:hypothetical protein